MIWLPADNDGCRFGHHCRWRATDYIETRGVDKNRLITTIINDLIPYYFVRDLTQHHGRVARTLDRVDSSTPRCWRGERLRHHGRGVCAACCGVVACCRILYVEKWYETTLRKRLSMLLTVPHWRATHLSNNVNLYLFDLIISHQCVSSYPSM